jgi:hypothetical protein
MIENRVRQDDVVEARSNASQIDANASNKSQETVTVGATTALRV